MSNLPAIQETSIAEIAPVSVAHLAQQVHAIQDAMRSIMQRDVHYGVIPGTGDKPTLLKPGAEKIGMMFRLAPIFDEQIIELPNGHREVRVKCTLNCGGNLVGQGVGACTTMESKYRWRKGGGRKCPKCGKESIIKGKPEYGGGWVCFQKKGGCGAKFQAGDTAIESQQEAERMENPDIADTYNTVLKMAKKRAHVDAIITATAAGDLFTQDLEDMAEVVSVRSIDVAALPAPAPRAAAQVVKNPTVGFASTKYEEARGPTDFSRFKYRYHIPVKKAGKDMDAVRAWLKSKGFQFNPEDKHWYGHLLVDRIQEYLRPLEPEKEEPPAPNDDVAQFTPDDQDIPFSYDDEPDPKMPNI